MEPKDIKFRASSISKLMVEGEKITTIQLAKIDELQAKVKLTPNQDAELARLIAKRDTPPQLSKTTISYLEEVAWYLKYGKQKEIHSKYLSKGKIVEEASLSLYSEITGNFVKKNEETMENEYCTGTPDAFAGSVVIDTKSCYDHMTFHRAELTDDNEWQMRVYMWLYGLNEANIIKTLVNTPKHIVLQEVRKKCYELGITDWDTVEYMEVEQLVENNHTFDNIPAEKRIKIFPVYHDESIIEALKAQIERCRVKVIEIMDSI